MDEYIRDNWRSDGSVEFGKRVDALGESFGELYTLLEKLADGYLGLNGALMVFVTAIMEALQLRAEDTEASWSNLVNGGLTVLGVALDWKSALGWLSLALFTVDMARRERLRGPARRDGALPRFGGGTPHRHRARGVQPDGVAGLGRPRPVAGLQEEVASTARRAVRPACRRGGTDRRSCRPSPARSHRPCEP